MLDSTHLGKRLTTHYALIQCIYNMGYCCIMSFAAVFLLSRGFTNSHVGLILTLASALALICQPMIATFADRTQNIALRTMVATLLLANTLIAFVLLIMPSLLLPTAILYILLVCFHITQQSLITSMSMEHINTGIHINFSLARGIGSFAFALLSLAMGFLVNDYGAWIVMPITMSLGLSGILLVSSFQKAQIHALKAEKTRSEGASSLIEFAKKNKSFIAIVGSIALMFFSHTLINTYTIQIMKHVGGTSADMGIATAIAGFLELPAMALFPFFLRKIRSPGTIMKLSGVFLVIKTLITLLAPNVLWINIAQCLQFFGFAMFIPSSVYYVNHVIDEVDKVKGQASMGMALGISGMIGNVLGGLMLDTSAGVPFMLTVGMSVSCVGVVLVFLVDNIRARQKQVFNAV